MRPDSDVSLPFNWVTVLRLPFTTVALFPFAAGIWMAHQSSHAVHWPAAILGLGAVFCIVVTCYLIGEIQDIREDLLTIQHIRTPFSGGTLLVAQGRIPPGHVWSVAGFLLLAAGAAGLWISYVHQSWTLLGLGVFGAAAAVTYSLPPVRLVKRGLGEIFIGICYGWLTLVTGFAAATGQIPPFSHVFAIPQALTIFNVILLNEFPDYEPDRATGKRNLVVLLGRERASLLYALACFLTAVSILWIWIFFRGGSFIYFLSVLPVAGLSLFLALRVGLQGGWRNPATLEKLCGLGILLNLITAVTLALVVVV